MTLTLDTKTDSKTAPGPYTSTPRVRCEAEGTWHIHGYAEAKELLLADMRQAGFNADEVIKSGLDPVLYQHGEPHRQQRAAIAKFFSPTTTHQKHLAVIERLADEVIGDLVRAKRADLNELSVRMAASVAAAVVGLTPSPGLIRRLDAMLHAPSAQKSFLQRVWQMVSGNSLRFSFWWSDVRPAIAARRRQPQEDVISYMLSKGKGDLPILAECVVYGAAGMATTQEFISVVLWHCLQRPEYKELMLTASQEARYEFLHEVLRLEPVIASIKRRALETTTLTSAGQTHTIPAGALINFHVYDINADARVLKQEPLQLQPQRELERGISRSLVSFGAGPHRCAGEFIALVETDVFLRRLLALPGLRLESGPTLTRNETVEGYEVRQMMIAVD
jgi:cytochrome P450